MPRIVKAADVRQKEILDCAARLFSARGYDETSVGDIVAELGISKGAFYHHFESKEALVGALAADYARASALTARDILEDETLDSFSRLNLFLARMRRHKLEQVAELGATFEPIFREENIRLYHRTLNAVMQVVRPILARIIAEGVEERTFDTPDPDNAAEIIIQLMGSARDQIIALYAAAGGRERDRITCELTARMRYIGTVIDRILGLPEGSIELVDDASIAAITATLRAA